MSAVSNLLVSGKKIRYPVQDERLYRCIAIAMTQKRFLRSSLKEALYNSQLYQDFHQTLAEAGVAAWRSGYDPDSDFKQIKRMVSRAIYRFLIENGFHRYWDYESKKQGKGFVRREAFFTDYYKNYEPVYQFGDNTELIMWMKGYITDRLGRDAWREVMKWTKSRRPEPPRGIVAEAISILKKEAFSNVNV